MPHNHNIPAYDFCIQKNLSTLAGVKPATTGIQGGHATSQPVVFKLCPTELWGSTRHTQGFQESHEKNQKETYTVERRLSEYIGTGHRLDTRLFG
ncbi:hypothetical protein TNCV_4599121 [Trichonephila clavipes]|nr:hypothetical protein TNCV_4599121 [Trichonephila clavipes]